MLEAKEGSIAMWDGTGWRSIKPDCLANRFIHCDRNGDQRTRLVEF